MVAMAASKENPSCSSSSSSASAYRSLRTPLSPLHHNTSAVRPSEHSTPVKASRCSAANPTRALLPPLGIKSPPHPTRNLSLPGSPHPAYRTLLPPHGIKSPPHLSRNLSLPRSPNPVSAGRKLSRDGVANLDLTSRFKPQASKEKDRIPAAAPRCKSSIPPLYNTRQSKRQTQLFVQQKATVELFAGDKVGPFSQKQVHQTEDENSERPCRKKWRRFPRESVLRSLRGDKAQECLATTGMEKPHRDANPCSIPKEVELLQLDGLNVVESPLRELSFDIYADGTFAKDNHSLVSGSQSVSQVSAKNEEAEQENIALFGQGAQTCSQVSENRAEEKCLTICLPGENSPNHSPNDNLSLTLTSPNCTLNKSLSLTITPPTRKSLPTADKNLTPPMQSTQSPDFIKREGVRGLLPIEGTCFAAPCALVKDRRKCKPRGVLTVDAGHETLSSIESDPGFDSNQSVQQIPTPAVASVEWMLEEKRTLGGGASPQLVETSTDLCRMSFPNLSPCHLESSSAQHGELRTCSNVEDEPTSQQGSMLQASLSFSGYEWGASSSQGLFSSCRTEASSANPRRSIVFDDNDDDMDRSEHASTKFKSKIMGNILYEEIPEISSMDFSDGESDEYLGLRGVIPLEGSPPFGYSLFSSLKVEESSKMSNQKAWPKCLQEEMLVMSGPMDSLMSSPDGEADVHSIALTGRNYAGPLVPFQGGKNLWNRDYRPLDLAPEFHHGSADISSRLAMAEYLCKITATYLEDIATSLGKDQINVDATKVCAENMDNLSLEQSSIVEGRKKMAECCSLLRGLTLETSKSKENSRLSSECSVNQPSPSSVEDSADSSFAHVKAKGCRSQELLSSQFSSREDDSVKACQTWNLCKISPNGLRAPLCRHNAKVKACLPSRGFVAGAYLLAGLFVISHTYHKHVKQNRQLN